MALKTYVDEVKKGNRFRTDAARRQFVTKEMGQEIVVDKATGREGVCIRLGGDRTARPCGLARKWPR